MDSPTPRKELKSSSNSVTLYYGSNNNQNNPILFHGKIRVLPKQFFLVCDDINTITDFSSITRSIKFIANISNLALTLKQTLDSIGKIKIKALSYQDAVDIKSSGIGRVIVEHKFQCRNAFSSWHPENNQDTGELMVFLELSFIPGKFTRYYKHEINSPIKYEADCCIHCMDRAFQEISKLALSHSEKIIASNLDFNDPDQFLRLSSIGAMGLHSGLNKANQ